MSLVPSTSNPVACDESVGYLLARVRSLLSAEVQQLTLPRFQLNSTQSGMLMLLRRGPHSGADLAREYGIDASAVTRLLDKLEDRELVSRTRSAVDRRVVFVALTLGGETLIDQLLPLYTSVLERMLGGFTEAEAGLLKSLLVKILVNYGSEDA